jgi:hypothetical protein
MLSSSCHRCRQEFDERLLAPPSLWLRTLAGPFFYLLPSSTELRQEFVASYCPFCRRQLNFCFFFVAFMVVLFAIAMVIGSLFKFGLI